MSDTSPTGRIELQGGAPLPPENAIEAAKDKKPEGVTLSARLRAKAAQVEKGTERIAIPGWGGDLVMEAKVIKSRKALEGRISNVLLIERMTDGLLMMNDDDELETVPGGWSGLGELTSLPQDGLTNGQIIKAILDNPARLDAFGETLVAWMIGSKSKIEQILGE